MRILIVEDNPAILSGLRKKFETECFAVDTAESGDTGAYLAKTNDYDLLVLDNMLPKKNGIDICKEVRDHGKTVPILVLSVVYDTEEKVALLEAGADDYLVKPFRFEELLARVRALLRRPRQLLDDVLQLGPLTLDKKKHTVTREGELLKLTKKEFMLLTYFLEHVGQVLSRAKIMEHVWDMNADPFSNTIETHVRSLRKKINDDAEKMIHTVPGIGYKIIYEQR